MKPAYLLAAGLLLATTAYAQQEVKTKKDYEAPPALPVDATTHLVDYTAVVEVPGAKQSDLYARAFEWVAATYPGAANVLQNKELGRITVQGVTHPRYRNTEFGNVTHTFNIYVKDGKYKYEFTDFRHEFKGAGTQGGDASLGPFENDTPRKMMVGAGMLHRVWNSIRNQTDEQINVRIASLAVAMAGNSKAKSDF